MQWRGDHQHIFLAVHSHNIHNIDHKVLTFLVETRAVTATHSAICLEETSNVQFP